SDLIRWFIDPATGEILPWSEDMDEPSPEDAGARHVDPVPSHEVYEDMRDFVARVPERRAADLLSRAIEGRGAFRRFKDTLFEFPELREAWFRFHDVRLRRRAIEWLQDASLVDDAAAAAALAELEDPPVGDRLADVVVFGSYAMGTATDDSDLDLAVVVRDVADPWKEAACLDDVLWRHTLDAGITLSALVVDAEEWERPERPLLRTAKALGR